MLDDNQQRALCEYLNQDFIPEAAALTEASQNYFPAESLHDRSLSKPIQEEPRKWGTVRFTGLRLWHSVDDPDEWGWSGQIIGSRSDGQYIYVTLTWRPHKDEGDPEQLLRSRFQNALLQFASYRDCSCGSPCRQHPAKELVDA